MHVFKDYDLDGKKGQSFFGETYVYGGRNSVFGAKILRTMGHLKRLTLVGSFTSECFVKIANVDTFRNANVSDLL